MIRNNLNEATPLADVVCCQNVPEIPGHIQTSTELSISPNYLLDDRFLIREVIGRSGMATIYRAEDVLHGKRQVAVKVPLMVAESDPAYFTRFCREEEIGLKFSHPFLLKFYPVVGKKSRPYIVTELLRGCSLAHLGLDARPVIETDALKITSLICDAVDYMHEHGIIHRDLKPANIMICSDQTLRVMDLGLAAPPVRRRSVLAKLTPIFGTPEYMAPEQVENGSIDERTDVYALGAILYEMLTGVVPFQNEDAWQSAYQRTTGDPIAPRILNPLLSPQAEEIVLHALQRKPSDRYPSMATFRTDLSAPSQVNVTGYCERLRRPRWRLSFQATPVLTGLVLGLAAILFFVLLFFIMWMRLAHK